MTDPVPMRQAMVDYVYSARRLFLLADCQDDGAEWHRYSRSFEAFYSRYGDSPFVTDDGPTPNRPVYFRPEKDK